MEATTAGRFTCVPCAINEIFDTDPSVQACIAISAGKEAIHGMFAEEKCTYGHYSDSTSIADASSVDCL